MLTRIMIIFLLASSIAVAVKIEQPEQPLSGPGGREYFYREVTVTDYGRDENKYYIFEPANFKGQNAPVVAFIHGWLALDPSVYRLWIDHIVKKGNIVIYPQYQKLSTGADYFTIYAVTAIDDALKNLSSRSNHIKPDRDRFAIVGHSAGGIIAANIAAISENDIMLPKPKAVMCVEPGITRLPANSFRNKRGNLDDSTVIPLYDLRKIDPETLLITIVGDEDINVFDYDAKRIYNESIHIHYKNKDYVIMHSDYHGDPPLIADHYAPAAPIKKDYGPLLSTILPDKLAGVDALDHYGTWKLFDALINAAFYNRGWEYLDGSTLEKFMGYWSDGTPVKELTVYSKELP